MGNAEVKVQSRQVTNAKAPMYRTIQPYIFTLAIMANSEQPQDQALTSELHTKRPQLY